MRLPPGPPGWPVLGVMPALRRDPTGVFMAAALQYGDVSYLKIANCRGYLVTDDDLERLPYTRMVIEETMRLYPPAWGFSRLALGPDRIGEYELPPGWLIFVIPWVMHRHPKYWDDPERFDPERFSPLQSGARPKFVYLPFGAGPRQCIGNHFAMMEAQIIVATLAQRYRLHLVPGQHVVPRPLITLRPRNGITMRIESRAARPAYA